MAPMEKMMRLELQEAKLFHLATDPFIERRRAIMKLAIRNNSLFISQANLKVIESTLTRGRGHILLRQSTQLNHGGSNNET